MQHAQDEEEQLLRSVALQNANSILLARQRAEQELRSVKDALERKTDELARSLSVMRATLESTTDGILVTSMDGELIAFSEQYLDMWGMTREQIAGSNHWQILEIIAHQLADREAFLARVREIYATASRQTFDVLELADGRVFERFSTPIRSSRAPRRAACGASGISPSVGGPRRALRDESAGARAAELGPGRR